MSSFKERYRKAMFGAPANDGDNKTAMRYNEGKPDWTLIDFKSLRPLVDVMTYGAKKYDVDNWKLPCENPRQHLQSAMRHMLELVDGNEIDDESGCLHSGHVIANMMMYNYHKHRNIKNK